MIRIPFGLERLPRNVVFTDPRLPAARTGAKPLRLNSEAVSVDAMEGVDATHAARVAAMVAWLQAQCGDYAPRRRRFIAAYFDALETELITHRDALSDSLRRYDGLYTPDDFLWSALRPLPRAWLAVNETVLSAEIVFWDGARPLAIELSARETPRQLALRDAGIDVIRLAPDAIPTLASHLPTVCRDFWRGETLPSSPFRRPIPHGVVTT